ncbi:MAG TPA: hypothetical protein VFB32_14435 [Rudaea sp.]|nr:hypothetical protein [Rudaea sp.]
MGILFRRIAVLLVLGALASPVVHACTREDAFNRMMGLNQFAMKLQAKLPDPLKDPEGYNAKLPRFREFSERLAGVGKTLADNKFDEACAAYDALARDFQVDIAAQGVRPLSALEAEAEHPPQDGCDLGEAAKRSVELTEKFQKRADAEHLGRDDWQRFGKDMEPVGLAMQKDPFAACAMMEAIAAKYKLH